jgi:hypothetical protein
MYKALEYISSQNTGLFLMELLIYIVTCRGGLFVTYRRVLDWTIGFIDNLFTQLGTTDNYSVIAVLHILQFTVTHVLGFQVFTSRILATDLSQSHCHFKSHLKSSFDGLISFLPLFCNCQFRKLDSVSSILFSQGREIRLDSTTFYADTASFWTLLYNHAENTSSLLLGRGVYGAVA